MKNEKIPDKLSYTKGELIAEIIVLSLVALLTAAYITLFAAGIFDGIVILMIVITLIIYGIFTVCSVYPQWSNIVNSPEKCSEKTFRRIRRNCIAAKLILTTAVFTIQIIPK